ncbi:MAG: MBL fold metallo-hydrolase [Myxococcales bacterium]|nr:MBL fold metallo-hydrolase [Myxococcales bacterium]
MGRFDHLATQPSRGPGDIVRWKVLDRLRGAPGPQRGAPAPSCANDGAALRSLAASLTWVGHASFVLRLGGRVVVIDPVWSTRIQGVVPRHVAPGVALDALPPVDVVLISHAHHDHLDLATLTRIGPNALYVVPLGVGALLKRNGLPRVIECDWWQSTRVGDLELTLVPARHWSMRGPFDRNDALWGGWVLRGPEGTAYHTGDTGYFDGFAEIRRRLGVIDWAMMPIGAYEPRWFMQPQHMNPDDAFRAFADLEARHFVAMHWGTFQLTDEPLDAPPGEITRLFEASPRDPSSLWLLDVGETRALAK